MLIYLLIQHYVHICDPYYILSVTLQHAIKHDLSLNLLFTAVLYEKIATFKELHDHFRIDRTYTHLMTYDCASCYLTVPSPTFLAIFGKIYCIKRGKIKLNLTLPNLPHNYFTKNLAGTLRTMAFKSSFILSNSCLDLHLKAGMHLSKNWKKFTAVLSPFFSTRIQLNFK